MSGVPLIFECTNCEQHFDYPTHLQHICEYDSDGEAIILDKTKVFETNKAVRLLRNNSNELQSIVGVGNDGEKGKKPYNCAICSRSYVHGTGLARHMRTHNVHIEEKTSRATSNVTMGKIEEFKVVCQCLYCGRIFCSVSDALKHYGNAHGFGNVANGSTSAIENKENNDLSVEEKVLNTYISYKFIIILVCKIICVISNIFPAEKERN